MVRIAGVGGSAGTSTAGGGWVSGESLGKGEETSDGSPAAVSEPSGNGVASRVLCEREGGGKNNELVARTVGLPSYSLHYRWIGEVFSSGNKTLAD